MSDGGILTQQEALAACQCWVRFLVERNLKFDSELEADYCKASDLDLPVEFKFVAPTELR